MLFVDAGTVHAIGPGVVLLETQQTSDITYRLYDYGRPRELHLEQGIAVIKAKTEAGKVEPRVDGWLRSPDRAEVLHRRPLRCLLRRDHVSTATGPACLVSLSGWGTVKTANGSTGLKPGQAVVLPAGNRRSRHRCAGNAVIRALHGPDKLNRIANPVNTV